jgi:excisionase family DNA binding protein
MQRELTIKEVADLKQVSQATIRRKLATGELRCRRYSQTCVRIPQEALEEFDRRVEKR